MTVVVRFDDEAEAGELVSLDGERLALISSKAFAPGQPIRVAAELAEERLPLEGRSLGSKKREDGRFDVRVRLVNLSRAVRERLEGVLDA